MTPLDSKSNRDSYGIDTFERGLVYAALLLRASNTDPNNEKPRNQNRYFNAVRMAFNFNNIENNIIKPLVLIQAKLPYDSLTALRQGGSFLKNIGEFGNSNPNPFKTVSSPSIPNNLQITQEPELINTLEKYLAWTATNLICGFISLNPINSQQVSIQILEEDQLEPSLQINASLPLNYKAYLVQNNIISAITSAINKVCVMEVINNVDSTTNEGALGNETILDN